MTKKVYVVIGHKQQYKEVLNVLYNRDIDHYLSMYGFARSSLLNKNLLGDVEIPKNKYFILPVSGYNPFEFIFSYSFLYPHYEVFESDEGLIRGVAALVSSWSDGEVSEENKIIYFVHFSSLFEDGSKMHYYQTLDMLVSMDFNLVYRDILFGKYKVRHHTNECLEKCFDYVIENLGDNKELSKTEKMVIFTSSYFRGALESVMGKYREVIYTIKYVDSHDYLLSLLASHKTCISKKHNFIYEVVKRNKRLLNDERLKELLARLFRRGGKFF